MRRFLVGLRRHLQDRGNRLLWLRRGLRLVAVGLATLHWWAAVISHSMNPDGISYLDIGDAYFRGDWHTAINTVWSPLYSWILGAVMWLVNPPMRWEFPTVHVVNFVIFVLALCAFEFMWTQLGEAISRKNGAIAEHSAGSRDGQARQLALPEWAWWSLGYLLFIWATLNLIQIWAVTPDMLMAALVFWAAGLIAQVRANRASWWRFALLGFVLGLGYLSKAIMLPVSVFFLAAAFWAVEDRRRAMVRTGAAVGCLLLVAGPFVAAMSMKSGRFTYGDVGRFVYVRQVNQVIYPHWQGEPPGDGVPVHPSRQIFDNPPIYEFGSPIGGTYPISFDQSYWYEGVVVRFDPANQLRQLISSALYYADLFVYQQAALLFGLALLYGFRRCDDFSAGTGLRRWLLSGLGLMGLLLYAPILVAGRYVGAFVLLFWSDLLAHVRVPDTGFSRRVVHSASLLMILFLLTNIAVFNLQGLARVSGHSEPSSPAGPAVAPDWPGEVAEQLHGLGIQPGDRVGVIGYGFDSFWARLARVQIVAEMLGWEADPFWLGDDALQADVLEAFSSTGAEAVVAENVPPYASLVGWHRVGNSNYYILPLSP